MLWFTFRQNNSGGFYIGPKYVIVEATSSFIANALAEENNVYFHGCSKGIDCNCCGDRWSKAFQNDGEEKPMIFGEVIDPENPFYQDSWGAVVPAEEIQIVRMSEE